jgi:heme-degrading monooxygenase HmoA
MVMVILRVDVRAGMGEEFESIVSAAHDVALATRGFVAFDRYASPHDEQAMLLEFESHEALAAWRDHPDNAATQAADRDRLFSAYRIQVCDVVREYEFASP